MKHHDGLLMAFLVTQTEATKVLKSYTNMEPLVVENIDGDITAFDGGLIRLMSVTKVLAPQDWLKIFDELVK